jgi:glycogenin glucosyltransferase
LTLAAIKVVENFGGMMNAYISLLSTDDYLPGAIVLHRSLMETKPCSPFVLLITDNISQKTRETLRQYCIDYKVTDCIESPIETRMPNWAFTYSKLNIFALTDYKKLIYLDSDMIVLSNLDELFNAPHMSAVNCGGLLSGYGHWIQFASGLMVIEPSMKLFSNIMSLFGKVDFVFHGDQEVLYALYPNWPKLLHLHLDHGYHMVYYFFDRYHYYFNYGLDESDKPVKSLHFPGAQKPWHMIELIRSFDRPDFFRTPYYWKLVLRNLKQLPPKSPGSLLKILRNPLPLERQSLQLWLRHYDHCQGV